MMDLTHPKVLSKINFKKALVFVVHRSLKNKEISAKIKKFTGYQNIGLIKVNDLQNLKIMLEITEGKAVLIAIRKKQLKILADNNTNGYVTLPFSKGWARLRLIGDHASLNLKITKV